MPDDPRQPAFFDDRHTDNLMRGLISRFARLGSFLTVATAPLVATGPRLAFLLANASTAYAVTLLLDHFRLLDRATNRQLQALLLLYGVLIANGTGLAGGGSGAYLLLQALPVLFAAVFFRGPARYWIGVGVAAEHTAVLTAYGAASAGDALTVLAACLIVAHFGVRISDVLREAVATHRALHSVLTVSNDAIDTGRLPEIGLAAAVSVVGWDAAAVVVRNGDELEVQAAYGVSDDVRSAYAREPMLVDGPTMSAEVVRTGRPVYVADAVARLGPGHPLVRDGVVCMAAVPIRYHGEILGALVIDNRTPRVPDERELDRLAQVAEQLGLALGNLRAYRREAQVAADLRELHRRKDAFLATVSHELRTPATTITLAARTLRDADDRLEPADRAYAHDLLVRRSEELTGMIESLLEEALAESDGLRMELTSLDWGADLARWVAQARTQTGRVIHLDLPDLPVTSMGDRAKAERIVANLLSNAAKFSPPETPIRCALRVDGDCLEVAVRDEGPGVPAQARERVFDRFYQADSGLNRAHGGFGIGLSLVRRFAEAHGGSVRLDSVAGQGSTFTVRLPLAVVPAPSQPGARGAPGAGARLTSRAARGPWDDVRGVPSVPR